VRTAKFVELELERTGVTLLVNTDRDDVAAEVVAKLCCVVLTLAASGSVSDYADTSSIQSKVAELAGVDASAVTITVAAAPVLITATIAVPAVTTSTQVQATLSAALPDAPAATSALGITVESAPTIVVAAPPLIEVDCVNPLLKPKVRAPQRLIAPTPHLAHAVLAPQALFTRFMGDKEPSQTQQGSSFSEEINTSSGLHEKLHSLWQDIKQEGDTILAALGADCSSDLAPLCVEYHNLILEGFGPFKGKVEYKFVEESNRARGFVLLTGERTDSQVVDGRQERAMQSNGTGKSELPHA
jgi:hypothetical protein